MFGKKKKEVIDDSFDFDSELDFDDFNFDMSPPEDDRKPATKVASGFLEGLTTGLKDTSFIRQTVKDIFPRGFGETIDLYDKVAGSAKKLYDDSAAQIKPAIKDFKRVSSKLIPKDSKLLPESVKNLLKSWEEENDDKVIGKEDQKEAFLQSQLVDIFKAQTEADVKSQAEENARDDLKLGIDIKQHKDLFSLVNLIQSDISRLSQYERTIGLSYQKKSLELQYRQLFALQDLVTQGNQVFAMQKDALPKIVKNTSYPDYLKLTSTEFIKEINQRKFTEGIGKALFGRQAEFIEKMVSGIRDTVVSKVTDTVGDFRNSLLQIESQKDMMGDDVKIDKSTLAGNVAGGLAAEGIGTLGGKWLRENVVDKNPRIQQAGEKLESFVENVPRSINEFKKSDAYEYETGPIAWLMRNLKDFIPKHGADLEFDRKFQREMHEPAIFNKKTEKSITEIIPNYLARILREIQVFRTGNENIELTRFDYNKDKFTSDSKLKKQLLKSVVNQDSIKRNTREMDRMMEKIDPEKKLSKDASEQIRKRLLENSAGLNKATEKNLANVHKYQGDAGSEAATHMSSYISQLSDKDRVEFERTHNNLMETIADPRGAMENMIKLGYGNDLRSVGLLDETKRFLEKDTLMDMYLNPDKEVKSLTTTHKKRKVNKTTQLSDKLTQQQTQQRTLTPASFNVTAKVELTPVINAIQKLEKSFIESIDQLKQSNVNINTVEDTTVINSQEPVVSNLDTDTNDRIDETNRRIDTTNDLLKSIEELVKSGMKITINRFSGKMGDAFNMDNFSFERFKEFFNRTEAENNHETHLNDETKVSNIDKLKDFILKHLPNRNKTGTETPTEETPEQDAETEPTFGKGVAGLMAKMAYKSTKLGGKAVSGLGKVFKKSLELNTNIFKGIGRGVKGTGVRDVYVEGEETPRIYGTKLLRGFYRKVSDKTVIRSHEDINCPIENIEGQIVISEDELGKLYTKNVFGKLVRLANKGFDLLKRLGGGAFDMYKNFVPKLRSSVLNTFRFGIDKAKSLITGTWNLLDQPIDIYVPGHEDPVLLSVVMKAGGYISKTTKKPIMRPGDIDGPILDIDGNEVLTLDMLRKGLYDANGEKIKLPMQKILAGVGKVLGGIWNIQKGAWNLTKKIGSKIMNFGRNLFEGFSLEINGKKTATLLDKIYTFMVDHWGRKSIIGDVDGDGEREGSWQQLKKKVKTKYAKPEKSHKEKPEKKNNLLDTLLSSISGLTTGIGKLVTGALSIFGMGKAAAAAGTIASASGTAAGGAAAAGATAKGAGLLSKIATLGRGALALLPGMGAAGTAAAATTATTAAAASTAATAAAGTLGATAATGAATAATGGVLATLGTIGAGIVSFLASPVVLGTLAVAGLAYGGYKLYNHLKTKLNDLDRLRLVQYGFHKEDQDNYVRIYGLEQYLKDFTNTNQDGMLIREKDLDMKKLLGFFDLDHTNRQDLERFFRWYQNRFKPVYLTHCASMLSVKKSVDLNNVSNLKGNEIQDYLNLAAFPEGPYHTRYLPIKDPKYAYQDNKSVKAIVEELQLKYKIDKQNKSIGASDKLMGITAISKPDNAAVVQPNAGALTDPNMLQEKRGQKRNPYRQTSGVDLSSYNGDQKVVALLSVKYRAYGLKDLDKDKVIALTLLEKEVLKNLRVTNDDVSWSGDPIETLMKIKGYFGIYEDVGKDVNQWLGWFKKRFLSVFLDYATMFSKIAGNDSIDKTDILKISQQLDIAKLLAGHPTVWSVTETPFPGYLVNTDANSVKENIKFLEDLVKDEKLAEDRKALQSETPVVKAVAKATAATDNKQTGNLSGKTMNERSSEGTKYSPSNLDGESVPTKTATIKPIDSKVNPNGLRLASGKLLDGRNGFDAVRLAKGIKLEGMNPALMKQFYGMVEEYKQITGKDLIVTDAWRSYEDQVAAKKKHVDKAATPGNSVHEFGLGIDADSKALDEIEELGLMRKYGLTRPVGQEPWHIEPIGIQFDINKYKYDTAAAIQVIEEGIGRGGGGLGTIKDAPKWARNRDLSIAIAKVQIPPNVTLEKIEKSDDLSKITKGESNQEVFNNSALPSNGNAMKASVTDMRETGKTIPDRSSGMSALNAPGGRSNQMRRLQGNVVNLDTEQRPRTETGFVKTKLNANANNVNTKLENNVITLPANPNIKVSEPVSNDIQSVKQTVIDAAKMVGVDPNIAVSTVAVESGFKPDATASGSSAKGLYQFVNSTWKETVLKHGSKYGMSLNNADPLNARDNAIMGAHFIKDIETNLSRKIDQDIGPTETYLGHFLGTGGASTFLKNMEKDPSSDAANVMPSAAKANRSIFFDERDPKSFTEIYQDLDNKIKTKASEFGIKLSNNSTGLRLSKNALYQDKAGNVSNIVTDTLTTPAANMKNEESISTSKTKTNTTNKVVPIVPTVDVSTPSRNNVARVKDVTVAPESYAASVGIKTDREKDKIKQMTDIGRNPMSDAYGFNTKQINQQNKDNNPLLNLNLMKETEGLLGKSVDIQTEMLSVMKDIYGIILKKKETDLIKTNTSSNPIGTNASGTFTPPTLPVSMKKTA